MATKFAGLTLQENKEYKQILAMPCSQITNNIIKRFNELTMKILAALTAKIEKQERKHN